MSASIIRAAVLIAVLTASCRHTPDTGFADRDEVEAWRSECEQGDLESCASLCRSGTYSVPRDVVVQACFVACDGGQAVACGEGWLSTPDPKRSHTLAEQGCGYGAPKACSQMLNLDRKNRDASRRMTDRELAAIWETSCARHETLGCFYRGLEEAERFRLPEGGEPEYRAALAYFARACSSHDEQLEVRLEACERYACETLSSPDGAPLANVGKICREARLPVKWLTNAPKIAPVTQVPKDAEELKAFLGRCEAGESVACLGAALRRIFDAKGDTRDLREAVPLLERTCSDTSAGLQQTRACHALHCLTGNDPKTKTATDLTPAFRACDSAGINPDYNGVRLKTWE